MIEQLHSFKVSEAKIIEKVIDNDDVAINHMILPKSAALPEHFANSTVYMTVARGTVTLQLDSQNPTNYPAGSIIVIPYRTMMNVSNQQAALLELFVVKAPGPKKLAAD